MVAGSARLLSAVGHTISAALKEECRDRSDSRYLMSLACVTATVMAPAHVGTAADGVQSTLSFATNGTAQPSI
jgi:hypothetical protein